jgi:hypothetical protein|tara:strand:- start:132 stop:671 length:540 start_codon:yes stop_codon:yes gene_type:complete
MKQFDAPIPGQSLTNEPRNYPWERPPETTDPDEAIVHHLTRLGNPKMLNSILDGVSQGLPVSMLTEMILTGAVSQGIHSIDISMIVAPVIQDYIVNLLEEEDVEFEEFFPEEDESDILRNIAVSEALTNLRSESPKDKDPTSLDLEPKVEDMEEAPVAAAEPVEDKPKRGGLMPRKEVL